MGDRWILEMSTADGCREVSRGYESELEAWRDYKKLVAEGEVKVRLLKERAVSTTVFKREDISPRSHRRTSSLPTLR